MSIGRGQGMHYTPREEFKIAVPPSQARRKIPFPRDVASRGRKCVVEPSHALPYPVLALSVTSRRRTVMSLLV
jgi:hypothetical protein